MITDELGQKTTFLAGHRNRRSSLCKRARTWTIVICGKTINTHTRAYYPKNRETLPIGLILRILHLRSPYSPSLAFPCWHSHWSVYRKEEKNRPAVALSLAHQLENSSTVLVDGSAQLNANTHRKNRRFFLQSVSAFNPHPW